MTGTTCEALKTDLAFVREIAPLSPREIQEDGNGGTASDSAISGVVTGTPVLARRIPGFADLSYFYGDDVLTCFGDPAYYYAYWQQEPEDRALIAELIYPEQGLIFESYSLSVGPGQPATLHPRTEFYQLRRFPPTSDLAEIGPYMSYPWQNEKPDNPSWVTDVVREWSGWASIVLPQ